MKEQILKILKFQKQVILYGPPGTGKTFLAKETAKDLTVQLTCKDFIDLLDKYWTNFIKDLDGQILKTDRGSFSVEKGKQGESIYAVTQGGSRYSINKDHIKIILTETNCSPQNYRDPNNTIYPYRRRVAQEFINWLSSKVKKETQIKLIQFHPSYTYEDFVRGIQIELKDGQPNYKAVNKIFAQLCEQASQDPKNNYVLIIDEINRANLPAVLGELIYALEYRGEEVETPYEVNGKRTLKVPSNLYIIGTMNTADRSIGHIDYAIRRRFAFVPVLANKELITHSGARKLYEELIEKLFQPDNVAPDFRNNIEDIKVGHTYFMAKENEEFSAEEQIALKVVYQVIPLLREYERDGLLLEGKTAEQLEKVFKTKNPTVEDIEKYLRENQ